MKTFLRVWFCTLIAFVALAASRGIAATPGGTSIANTASATYADANNVQQTVNSNTIVAVVASVTGPAVGPKETACNPATDAVAAGRTFVRTFTVTNASNVPDAYVLSATASTGTIVSIAAAGAPFTNGGTLAQLQPGQSVQVDVTVNPGAAAVGTNLLVSLVARSTATGAANGQATDTASQCAIIAIAGAISGPGGAGTPIVKLVNGAPFATAQPGATLTYSVAFMNPGATVANNVVVTDVVPAGIVPTPGTVTIDGVAATPAQATIAGQTVTVRIATLAPGAKEIVGFAAIVAATAPLGSSIVNVAGVSADTIAAQNSTPAATLVGTANIVYDGLAGQAQPVAGAVLTLTTPQGTAPVALAGTATAPNTTNANPYQTATGGAYAFGLAPKQFGPVTYLLTIAAPGYLNRRIAIALVPDASGLTYDATLTALDGQSLAVPGGFALTKGPVTLTNVLALFGNLPLFRAQNITVSKSVDRPFASSGDRLVYDITFANVGTALGATTIVDTLPPGVVYAPGTGRVDSLPQEPKVAGRVLTWTLPALAAQHEIKYAAVILPGVTENTDLINDVTVTAVVPNAAGLTVSASASVDTRVVPGVFTNRTIVTGRVFYDVRKSGEFEPGDAGVPNVRVFLEDGESVVTDSYGRYNFPGVKPGMHVLRLDLSTLPPTAKPYADRRIDFDDQRSVRRLVHGVFDGGLIQDINFALEGSP